jgi:hypothetical protein
LKLLLVSFIKIMRDTPFNIHPAPAPPKDQHLAPEQPFRRGNHPALTRKSEHRLPFTISCLDGAILKLAFKELRFKTLYE